MPRKPGGKYKGKCGRKKDPAEIALENLEKAAAQRAKAIARAQELKARQMGVNNCLKSSKEEEEEAKKQKIMNLLVGGKKSLKKFYQCWRVGVRMVLKERALMEREHGWRHCCDCHMPKVQPGASRQLKTTALRMEAMMCRGCAGLGSTVFQMPFDIVAEDRQKRELMRSTNQALRPATSPSFARSPSMPLHLLASKTDQQQERRDPWLTNSEHGFHANTGRKCFLDKATMRMQWAPMTAEDKWSLSNGMQRAMTASHPQLGGL